MRPCSSATAWILVVRPPLDEARTPLIYAEIYAKCSNDRQADEIVALQIVGCL